MDDKTLKDILVICKGWYNKEKYPNVLKAMNTYYHKKKHNTFDLSDYEEMFSKAKENNYTDETIGII